MEDSATSSYAATLKTHLAHAPIKPSASEDQALAEKFQRHESVEPEQGAALTHLGQFVAIHPTRASPGETLPIGPGETLPIGIERSSAGFLIETGSRKVLLSKEKVQKEMDFFQKQVVIAYFVGGQISPQALRDWLGAVSKEVSGTCQVGRDLGHGFFQVTSKDEATTQKILMFTPHLSKWGTCIMQPWVPGFNASRPTGTKMPIWITLKEVLDEFISSAAELAQSIGSVLGKHRGNAANSDQKFCIAVQTGEPFTLSLEAENPVTGKVTNIQVDYNNLPIRCRFCLSTSHLIKVYTMLHGPKRMNSRANPASDEERRKQQDEGDKEWQVPKRHGRPGLKAFFSKEATRMEREKMAAVAPNPSAAQGQAQQPTNHKQ